MPILAMPSFEMSFEFRFCDLNTHNVFTPLPIRQNAGLCIHIRVYGLHSGTLFRPGSEY
ncbi:hypothetical protein OIDMADRAFT_16414 [Oidiodendron maius Zn]|uniref:Uncharacterized protein n=1 Tax=Oidiodendron maius (strain Zn) TaxID=913774 RepID=A0A0C3D9F4_OIDMZ|nr:hypothetical protein OIDMADRAFT_16414 [Oidiodendron maius Zn]